MKENISTIKGIFPFKRGVVIITDNAIYSDVEELKRDAKTREKRKKRRDSPSPKTGVDV